MKGAIKKAFLEKDKDRKKWGEPTASYKLTFESQESQLESIYYWLLDFVKDAGWDVKKVTDNFMSSPGSGHFSDMGQRATKMQEEGMKILGALNQVIKSVLNLIYDLKEFEIRLEHYDDANSKDKKKQESGTLALKQIWLDSVDLKRGRGSIHQMANEMGFSTIRELFMIANDSKDLDKMNEEKGWGIVNDQVKRILIPRLEEFNKWKGYSEKELRKRMQIEKSYLKSQVETIKLYSSWVKPYLDAVEKLKQTGFEGSAALVNAFSTSLFKLEILGKKEMKEPPVPFKEYKLRRKYYQVILVTLNYRGHVSQRVTQKGDYGFAAGGRLDMNFDSYSLNEEELKLAEAEMEKEDLAGGLKFSSNMAEEALATLKEDLDRYLKNEKDPKTEKKEESNVDDINPFKALFQLFGLFKGDSKKDKGKIEKPEDVKKDNYVEKLTRADAAKSSSEWIFTVYDVYKTSHGMQSPPRGGTFENADKGKTKEPKVEIGDVFRGIGKQGSK